MTRARLLFALGVAWFSVACTRDSYVVGALCTAVGSCPDGGTNAGNGGDNAVAGSGGSATKGFTLDLTGSGVERLPAQFFGLEPMHFLVAADATTTTWPARVGLGFDFEAADALTLGEPAPFADPGSVLSHAGKTAFTTQSSWANTQAGALALEVVFRGEPGATLLSQRAAKTGLDLTLAADGRLNLRLTAPQSELLVSSQPLVPDAWHHCLALFDSTQAVAQVLCNGQAGVAIDLPSGFALGPIAAPVTLGSNSGPRLHWAQLASWEGPNWSARGSWTDIARERFARLVGTYADGAPEPLPNAEVRASGAYIDMTSPDAPNLRRLHPVGEDWPRIVCRPTNDSPRTCGLLVEASSSQPVAPASFTLDHWNALELGVSAADANGPTGAASLFAVTPSARNAEHTLAFDATLGDGPAVLSFFARPGSVRLVRAEVLGVASASFDLGKATVLESTGTLVTAAEAWGDGLVRASLSFAVNAGPGTVRLTLLTDDRATTFAGDGTVAADIGDVELRFRSYSAPLPTFGAIQQADHLVYPAGNGNLPPGPSFSFSAEIWLPSAPLLADAAVLNANFAARYDQQINLFISPEKGAPQFWGLRGTATPWRFASPTSVTDGNVHQVKAAVGSEGATLSVDGHDTKKPAGAYDLSVLDRVEIGNSTSSSGPLTGIVRNVVIAPP